MPYMSRFIGIYIGVFDNYFPWILGAVWRGLRNLGSPFLAIKRELYEELLYLPATIEHFFSYTYSLKKVGIIDREMTVFTCSIKKSEVDKPELKAGRCFSFFTTQELKNRKVSEK